MLSHAALEKYSATVEETINEIAIQYKKNVDKRDERIMDFDLLKTKFCILLRAEKKLSKDTYNNILAAIQLFQDELGHTVDHSGWYPGVSEIKLIVAHAERAVQLAKVLTWIGKECIYTPKNIELVCKYTLAIYQYIIIFGTSFVKPNSKYSQKLFDAVCELAISGRIELAPAEEKEEVFESYPSLSMKIKIKDIEKAIALNDEILAANPTERPLHDYADKNKPRGDNIPLLRAVISKLHEEKAADKSYVLAEAELFELIRALNICTRSRIMWGRFHANNGIEWVPPPLTEDQKITLRVMDEAEELRKKIFGEETAKLLHSLKDKHVGTNANVYIKSIFYIKKNLENVLAAINELNHSYTKGFHGEANIQMIYKFADAPREKLINIGRALAWLERAKISTATNRAQVNKLCDDVNLKKLFNVYIHGHNNPLKPILYQTIFDASVQYIIQMGNKAEISNETRPGFFKRKNSGEFLEETNEQTKKTRSGVRY
jgi:hypothetical protein